MSEGKVGQIGGRQTNSWGGIRTEEMKGRGGVVRGSNGRGRGVREGVVTAHPPPSLTTPPNPSPSITAPLT